MVPFHGSGSTTSGLKSYWEEVVTTTIPEVPGTHLIDLGKMKGLVELGGTQWF